MQSLAWCALLLPFVQTPEAGSPPQPTPAPAQVEPLALEFEAITLEQGLKGAAPHLSRGADGSVHVVWTSSTAVEGESRLNHRRWTNGKLGPLQVLEQGTGWFVNWADFPQYQEDADGGAVFSWLAHPPSGRGYGTMFRKRREAGAAFSIPQVLHEDREAIEHGFVSLVPLGDGRFFANWLQSAKEGPPTGLRTAILTTEGRVEGERVLDELVCDCCSTDSVVLPSGKVLIAYRNRTEEEVRDIQVRRGVPGDPTSWEEPVTMGGGPWKTTTCPVNGPALAADGSFVSLAGYSEDWRGTKRVSVVCSRGGGKRWLARITLGVGDQVLGRVDTAILPEGGPIVVTWLERTETGAVWCARAMTRLGKPGPLLRFAEVEGARPDGFLRLEVTEGGILAAWTDGSAGEVKLGLLKLPSPR